jgi:hypothetical protein
MPTKNFFPLLLLAPTRSSHYPFLYSTCKRPLSIYSSGMMLNCQPLNYSPSSDTSSTTLNCNLTQTLHDMPSSHVRHLRHLRHWMYCGMPSGPYVILGHLGQLRHPGHLGHLGHLSNIGDLDPLDPTPTDSLPEAFITEMDPTDPGLS